MNNLLKFHFNVDVARLTRKSHRDSPEYIFFGSVNQASAAWSISRNS